MRMNIKQIALCTGGRFVVEAIDPAMILTSVEWDSRDVRDGALFVALPGEKVDGHKFVSDALSNGAMGVLVNDAPDAKACILAKELGAAIIEVPNTMHAICDLAREWRTRLKAKVIGITGSAGKTTTKNLVRDVCASTYQTTATKANQNNELGVPKTLLDADISDSVVVVEMGMRGLGQIRELCDIARPDWGLITNIGESHMELLGSTQNIANAKAELIEALPQGSGIAFLNAADPNLGYLQNAIDGKASRLSFVLFSGNDEGCGRSDVSQDAEGVLGSMEASARIWAEDVSLDPSGCASFTICAKGFPSKDSANPGEPTLFDMEPDVERAECTLSLQGIHNVSNAISAAAVGRMLGISLAASAKALGASLPEAGRMEKLRAHDGFMIINDAYNANPDSMRVSLAALCDMDVSGKRCAVLGDMGELGDIAKDCHISIGGVVASLPIDTLICIGELAQSIADGALDSGMEPANVIRASNLGDVLEAIEGRFSEQDVVLVKASHFMGLERIVEGLIR